MALSTNELFPSLEPLKKRLIEDVRSLSFREKALIAAAAVAVMCLMIAHTYRKIADTFAAQSTEMASLDAKRQEVIENLARYAVLRARKQNIESEYTKAEIREGVRSYLEKLLREKAKVTSGSYNITDRPVSEFGGSYELAPYSVRFTATSLQGLVDLLREVTKGQKPLILTELEFRKSRVGERMDVSLDVSSIRRK